MIVGENTYLIKGKVFERMTDEEFYHFCQENETIHFERDENKNIIIMPPTGSYTGSKNSGLNAKLYNWNEGKKLGVIFDSSSGFTLPDGSNRSPNAAWVSQQKWNALKKTEKKVFAPICPEFIVELRSESDRINYLQNKMLMWISNGVHLGWLIDPAEEKTHIYRKDGSIQIVNGFDKLLSGEDILNGFELDLSILK